MLPHWLVEPVRLWSREEVLARPCPVPSELGVYAWYFRTLPPSVPVEGCIQHSGLTLLYLGIAPKAPPTNGARPSSQRLRHRLRYHYRGNAEGSTLRLTLGCLLATHLGLQLRRVGSGNRLTFAAGEATLSAWMQEHAFVTWMVHPMPWLVEEELIGRLRLPLNLDKNDGHPFHSVLAQLRQEARTCAKELPIVP
jgi:hypothetical protein